jgi:uncharacterized protein YdaU (DUF1376 family)
MKENAKMRETQAKIQRAREAKEKAEREKKEKKARQKALLDMTTGQCIFFLSLMTMVEAGVQLTTCQLAKCE